MVHTPRSHPSSRTAVGLRAHGRWQGSLDLRTVGRRTMELNGLSRSMRVLLQRQALVLLALVVPSIGSTQAPALTSTERTIATAVDSHNREALALLERLVNINSGTMNFAGVRQVGDILRAQFDTLGFKTRWVDGAAFHRAGHLIAEHPGPGLKVLLVGHLDTVFEPSSPFQRFQPLEDSTARGPG